MSPLNCPASCCRHCRYYVPEGRRGGNCLQLNVPVQGSWKACSLSASAFAPSWETLKEMMLWQPETLSVQEVDGASTPDTPAASVLSA